MKCPICGIDLTMSDRQGVEIDYCPKCRGIWLDRGELDKIIEKSLASETVRQPLHADGTHYDYTQEARPDFRPENDHFEHDDHGDRHGHTEKYGGHKKKTFLGELFDF